MKTLIPFLGALHKYPRFYWKGRNSLKSYVGYGENSSSPMTFKARVFHENSCEGIWGSFPKDFTLAPDQILSSDWKLFEASPSLPSCVDRKDTPTFEEWRHMVQDACTQIQHHHFRKIVLSRQTTLTFDAPVNPLELLKGLQAFGHHTSLFMVQLDPSTAFLGASPEKLFSRIDRKISTEALAGTIALHEKWSPKEYEEVGVVRTFLQEQLSPCCNDLRWAPPEERPFGSLRHLYQKLEGILKTKISDHVLISQLHPTPALGGFPRERVLDYLKSVEPHHRGWYGAPIGVFSDKETDLAIAIRSMLVCGKQLHLFSGAGIVKDSESVQEWQELDRKIAHVLKWVK